MSNIQKRGNAKNLSLRPKIPVKKRNDLDIAFDDAEKDRIRIEQLTRQNSPKESTPSLEEGSREVERQ